MIPEGFKEKMKNATGLTQIACTDFERLSAKAECDAILADMTSKLSVALINAVNLLDPQAVIIGHEGAFLPQRYLKELEDNLNRRILGSGFHRIAVTTSHFTDRAPLMGSVCLIFERLFGGEFFENNETV